MPSAAISFGIAQDSGVEEMAGAAPLSANVMMDAGHAVRRRPGVQAWADFPEPAVASEVLGIAVFGSYLVYVTADRKIHAWLGPGNVIELSDATAPTQLDSDQRPVFAVTQSRVIIAGGGALQKWEGTGLSARLGGSPPPATHVAAIATRLVVNIRGNTGEIQWSEPGGALTGGHETWPALNFTELEANPDPCVAIYEDTNELIGFGTKTLQMMDPDANVGFAPARTIQVGSEAAYSFAQSETAFYFLDALQRFIQCDGRSTTPISAPGLTKTVRDVAKESTTIDTWAFRLAAGANDVVLFVMPTAGRSFAYNLEAKSWSEWRGFSVQGPAGVPFSSYCRFPHLGLHLVGTASGHIRKLDFDASNDLGNPVVGEMVSPFNDQGSKRLKATESVKLTFRHTPGTRPRVSLSWRDDTGAFGNPLQFDITSSRTVEIRSLGTYRQRQWKLVISDDAPLTLVDATEDYQQLEV